MLIEQILQGVEDDQKIKDILDIGKSPLSDLVEEYKDFQSTHSDLHPIDDNTTGREFKDSVSEMPPVDLIKMLNRYTESVKTIRNPSVYEDPKVRDERRLRHWVIKVLVSVMAVVICMMAGVIVTMGVWKGVLPDTSILSSLMEMATEILKLIFSTS